MLSFWERESFTDYDFIVLGGGIVGLSTAIELRAVHRNARVAVLERGVFPSGASTKNAGFACFGSLTEVLSDLQKLTEEEVLNLVERRWKGLHLLRSRLGDKTIDYQQNGGYELLRSEPELSALDHRQRVNELLRPFFRNEVYRLASEKIDSFGFDKSQVSEMVFNPFEGQIHTGKMMKALQRLALSHEVDLYTGAAVERFEELANGVEVRLTSGHVFRASRLAICTNAFTKGLVEHTPLQPGRGVVLVTQPIEGLKFRGTFHFDEGFYYFRNCGNRVIFGGGRNLDLEGEATTEFGVPDSILDKLKSTLDTLILPGQSYQIDQVWSGIMAFGNTKQPLLKQHSDRVYLGVRLGGMGVAIGSLLGKELAALMTESANN